MKNSKKIKKAAGVFTCCFLICIWATSNITHSQKDLFWNRVSIFRDYSKTVECINKFSLLINPVISIQKTWHPNSVPRPPLVTGKGLLSNHQIRYDQEVNFSKPAIEYALPCHAGIRKASNKRTLPENGPINPRTKQIFDGDKSERTFPLALLLPRNVVVTPKDIV